jgi:hypothetical protein
MMRWVFGADTAPFRKGLDQMRTQTKAFSGSVKGMLAGALGVGAIIAGFKSLFVEMDRVQKLGLRFGESAETIQKMSHAASLAGSDMEGLAKSITLATRNSVEAAKNGGIMADAFADLGINAGKFAGMSMESKVLELAKNFDGSSASAEQLAAIIQILGKSGAEMLPFLMQGQEALKKQFDDTATVSQSTVDAIANFNDSIEEMTNNLKAGGGVIVDFFRAAIGAFSIFYSNQIQTVLNLFDLVVNQAKAVGAVIEKTLSGDFDGAAKAAKRFGSNFSDFGKDLKNTFDAAQEGAKEMWEEIYGKKTKTKEVGPDIENLKEQAEAALKIEEEKKKLLEEIAKLKEDAAMSELSTAEKILKIEERRAELAKITGSDVAGLEAQKEILEGDKEIKKLREDQAKITDAAGKKADDLAKKAQEKEAKKNEDIQKAKDEETKVDRDKAFGAADDQGKLDMLKKEQEVLMMKSKEAAAGGDEEAAIRLRTEAKEKGGERSDLLSSLLEKTNAGPTIATSSLASIGAGGSSNLIGNTNLEQRKVSLLEQIAQNTGRGESGGANLPEPV